MATTTPNYGWDVPTSTDYVKDGATAIETLGDDIDATLYGLAGTNTKIGMHLLSTTTLSGASTTISGISQSYKSLEIWFYGMTNATADGIFRVAPNGSTTSAMLSGTSYSTSNQLRNTDNGYIRAYAEVWARTNADNIVKVRIDNYTSGTNFKPLTLSAYYVGGGVGVAENCGGGVKTNTAISSLVISNSGGSWTTGTAQVWGIN